MRIAAYTQNQAADGVKGENEILKKKDRIQQIRGCLFRIPSKFAKFLHSSPKPMIVDMTTNFQTNAPGLRSLSACLLLIEDKC